jgi:phosphoribosyl-ATP pyrophosphohydrolase
MELNELAKELHETALSKGFYASLDMRSFNAQAKQIAMIHSEATEILEALRKEKGSEEVVTEIADLIIRALDFYEALWRAGMVYHSLDHMLEAKAGINRERPDMHGVLG